MFYKCNRNWHSKDYIPYDNKEILRPVKIGDCVWIGCNVTITSGANIGDGVIISSGACVFGEIPKCAIVRGNPTVIIGYRNKDEFNNLYQLERFN